MMPEILFYPYFGPSRRSDLRVVEIRLDFAADEHDAFTFQVSAIRQLLLDAGVIKETENYPCEPPGDAGLDWYLALLAQTALMFQQKNGHRVAYFSVTREPGRNRFTVLVEHEHSEVGMAAVKLAIEAFSGKVSAFAEAYRIFSKFACEHALPLDTEVIINMARRRNIPVFQIEREPLSGYFNTGFRVRPNGLLILGYGKYSHVLDGTFCVDRAGDYQKALLRNPDQRRDLLRNLGIPPKQTATSADAAGRQFHLLIINRRVIAVESLASGVMQVVDQVHESLVDMCRIINDKVACAAVEVSLRGCQSVVAIGTHGWLGA